MNSLAFPDHDPELPKFVPEYPFNYADFEAYLRLLQDRLQAFWIGMAPVYGGILGTHGNDQDDGLSLTATIEDWPASFEAQQAALVRLLDTCPLRLAWRHFAEWMCNHPDWHSDEEKTEMLKTTHVASSKPLREIPLYRGWMRNSCQQIVCLPEHAWRALFDPSRVYRPQDVDATIVEALATRIARVLNEPFRDADATTPLWREVWKISAGSLVGSRDCHGMTDRFYDEYLRPIEHPPGQIPSWRFLGYYGHLRVDGIDNEPWHVVILAPQHFLVDMTLQLRAGGQS